MRLGPAERERELAALAKRQHGVVARRQLSSVGVGRGTIDAWVSMSRLHPLHRGVYALGHAPLGVRGRWMAAVLAHGEGAVLSHRSAAALWGLMRPRTTPVEVTSPRGRTGRDGIRLHRAKLAAEEATDRAGIPVTTPARTLLDLAGVLDGQRLARALEEADRLRLLEMAALERAIARASNRKGLGTFRGLVDRAAQPIVTRSALEERFAAFCRERGLPPPATNVELLGREVDACWPHRRIVVELDGFAYHGHRAAFERDRARDAALQAAGYRVLRVTARGLDREADRIAGQLRAMLGATGPADQGAAPP